MSFPPPFYCWRPHPWHGLEIGPDPPRVVHAFIEITPFALTKYEGCDHAQKVVEAPMEEYVQHYGG